jgi:hypothetical protein
MKASPACSYVKGGGAVASSVETMSPGTRNIVCPINISKGARTITYTCQVAPLVYGTL